MKLYLPKDTCLITFILAGTFSFHGNMTLSPCLHCFLDNLHTLILFPWQQPLSPRQRTLASIISNGNIPLPCCHGNMLLPPGISCARAPRQTEDSSSGEPYGKQALYFTKELIMHREVMCVPPSHYHTFTPSHFPTLCTLTLTPVHCPTHTPSHLPLMPLHPHPSHPHMHPSHPHR